MALMVFNQKLVPNLVINLTANHVKLDFCLFGKNNKSFIKLYTLVDVGGLLKKKTKTKKVPLKSLAVKNRIIMQ